MIKYFNHWFSARIETPDWEQVKLLLESKEFPFRTPSARVIDYMVHSLLPEPYVKWGKTTWETIVRQGDEDGFLGRAANFLSERFRMNDPGSKSKGAHILSKVCPFSLVQVHLCLNEKLRYQTHTKPFFDRCIVDND